MVELRARLKALRTAHPQLPKLATSGKGRTANAVWHDLEAQLVEAGEPALPRAIAMSGRLANFISAGQYAVANESAFGPLWPLEQQTERAPSFSDNEGRVPALSLLDEAIERQRAVRAAVNNGGRYSLGSLAYLRDCGRGYRPQLTARAVRSDNAELRAFVQGLLPVGLDVGAAVAAAADGGGGGGGGTQAYPLASAAAPPPLVVFIPTAGRWGTIDSIVRSLVSGDRGRGILPVVLCDGARCGPCNAVDGDDVAVPEAGHGVDQPRSKLRPRAADDDEGERYYATLRKSRTSTAVHDNMSISRRLSELCVVVTLPGRYTIGSKRFWALSVAKHAGLPQIVMMDDLFTSRGAFKVEHAAESAGCGSQQQRVQHETSAAVAVRWLQRDLAALHAEGGDLATVAALSTVSPHSHTAAHHEFVEGFATQCVLLDVAKLAAHRVNYEWRLTEKEDIALCVRCRKVGLRTARDHRVLARKPARKAGGCADTRKAAAEAAAADAVAASHSGGGVGLAELWSDEDSQ
jgi:hypothetical protein